MHAEWPELELHWLGTADESDCVCLVHASELRRVFGKTPAAKSGVKKKGRR